MPPAGAGQQGYQPPKQQLPPPQKAPQQSYRRPQPTGQPQDLFDMEDSERPATSRKKNSYPLPKGKKRRRWPRVLIALSIILALMVGAVLGAVRYFGGLLDPGAFGIIENLGGEAAIPKPYSKKDVVHFVIIGIDYEDGRDYGDGLGLTDMILYVKYDLKNNQLNMLQIPRDSYVGEKYPTGGTGKINALLISGENKQNPINNFVGPFESLFQLPIDYYIAMDMDALKTIVDTFGGLKVYVPRDMYYDGSSLSQGWQWLDGDAAEFFVRNRHGKGFERGDIDRLDNQRHFYSALFRRFLNLTPKDVMNLLPVFDHYCNTNLSLTDMVSIGVSALNLKAENVLFCKVPGATGERLDPTGQGRSLYIIDLFGRGTEEEPGLANLLNQHFRDPEHPVPAAELGLPQIQIPAAYPLYPPNVQIMAGVQDPEGGADVDVEPLG